MSKEKKDAMKEKARLRQQKKRAIDKQKKSSAIPVPTPSTPAQVASSLKGGCTTASIPYTSHSAPLLFEDIVNKRKKYYREYRAKKRAERTLQQKSGTGRRTGKEKLLPRLWRFRPQSCHAPRTANTV